MTTKVIFSDDDPKLSMMIQRRGISKGTIKTYNIVFNEIYQLFNQTPSDIVRIGKREQKPYIDKETGNWEIIELEDRTVTQYQFKYHQYLKERNLSQKTMKLKIDCFRALLGEYDIDKPKAIQFDIKSGRIRDEDIISWSELESAMSFCNGVRDKALICFFVSTGLRSSDVRRLTIADLIKACDIYFEEGEEKTIANLLAKEPDIIPCWDLVPQKTQKNAQLCITFNTPEASRYIWQYLTERIEKNIKRGENGELDPCEPLFATSKKKHLTSTAIEQFFQRLNNRIGNPKDKNGKFGRLRAHALRKLFTTTCRRNITQVLVNSDKTTELDIVSIFTGHIPPNESNSDAYEAIESDSEDSLLRKTYEALAPFLSIENIEIKDIKTQQYKDLEEQNQQLREQLEAQAVAMQREMDEQKEQYEQKIRHIESVNSALSTQMTDIQNQIDLITQSTNIERVQEYIQGNEIVEKYSLSSKIIELFKDDVKNGRASSDVDYMESLICRAYNHLIAEGEFPNPLEPPADTINDERMQKIRKETDEAYYHIIENQGVRVSKAQDKKIKRKLEIYELSTYNAGKEANIGDITEIIWDIIFNG